MYTLSANIRDPKSKMNAKQLRRSGFTPGCIFGSQLSESISIQMEQGGAKALLRKCGKGCVIQISLGDLKIPALIKEINADPLKGDLIHVDFQALNPDRKINSTAEITFLNADKVPGVMKHGLFEIPYTAFPADIVETIPIDLTEIPAGSRLMVKDLPLAKNEKIQLQIDPDSLILTMPEL